jgi:hypothetical protein
MPSTFRTTDSNGRMKLATAVPGRKEGCQRAHTRLTFKKILLPVLVWEEEEVLRKSHSLWCARRNNCSESLYLQNIRSWASALVQATFSGGNIGRRWRIIEDIFLGGLCSFSRACWSWNVVRQVYFVSLFRLSLLSPPPSLRPSLLSLTPMLWNMFLFRVVIWNHVGFCRAQLIMATLAKISGWAGNSSPSLSILSFSLSLVLSIYSPPPLSPELCIAHNIRWGTMSSR